MLARKLFICSAIEKCQEKTNCCPHKQPHIKDERCVPRECRYATVGIERIDCVPYEPASTKDSEPVHSSEFSIKPDVIASEPVTITKIEGSSLEVKAEEPAEPKKRAGKRGKKGSGA
jgi:hypothetical protein